MTMWCSQTLPTTTGRHGRDRASRARDLFPLCTSIVTRPMSVVFDLGTRLRVRMRTKFENGVLHNEQQPQSVVNGFY